MLSLQFSYRSIDLYAQLSIRFVALVAACILMSSVQLYHKWGLLMLWPLTCSCSCSCMYVCMKFLFFLLYVVWCSVFLVQFTYIYNIFTIWLCSSLFYAQLKSTSCCIAQWIFICFLHYSFLLNFSSFCKSVLSCIYVVQQSFNVQQIFLVYSLYE